MGKQKIHKFFIFPFFAIQLDGAFCRFVPQKARLFALLFSPVPPRGPARRQLEQQDGRNAVLEVPVPRFVVKETHGEKSTRAAEQQRECKQSLFGHAPRARNFGAALVCAVDAEREQIDRGEIETKISHFSSLASSTAAAAPRRALLKTSWMLESRLSPPVRSLILASR